MPPRAHARRQMGAAFPELDPRRAADRGDAALRGDAASRPRSTAACACSTTSSSACPTARPCPATPPSASTTPTASRSTSPRTRCASSGRTVDVAGFDAAMAEQKRQGPRRLGRLRRGRRRGDLARRSPSASAPTEFLGYDTETAEGQVLALVVDGRRGRDAPRPASSRADRAEPDPVLRRVGRPGRRHRPPRAPTGARVAITDVRKKAGLFVHLGRVEEGTLARGAAAELAVDHDRRTAIRAQPLGDPPAARGAAPRPRRARRPARQPRRARPAALRLRPRRRR